VAVHEVVRNKATPAKDQTQPLPLPKGVSNYAVGCRNVPEPEITVMLVLICLAGLAILWRRKQHRAL
jgi:Ca-activated chloride channel family protein